MGAIPPCPQARTLDEGWDLGRIRGLTQRVLDRRSDAAFWLVSVGEAGGVVG